MDPTSCPLPLVLSFLQLLVVRCLRLSAIKTYAVLYFFCFFLYLFFSPSFSHIKPYVVLQSHSKQIFHLLKMYACFLIFSTSWTFYLFLPFLSFFFYILFLLFLLAINVAKPLDALSHRTSQVLKCLALRDVQCFFTFSTFFQPSIIYLAVFNFNIHSTFQTCA